MRVDDVFVRNGLEVEQLLELEIAESKTTDGKTVLSNQYEVPPHTTLKISGIGSAGNWYTVRARVARKEWQRFDWRVLGCDRHHTPNSGGTPEGEPTINTDGVLEITADGIQFSRNECDMLVYSESGSEEAAGEYIVENGTTEPTPDFGAVDGYVRPSGDPETVPPELVCDEPSFRRVRQWVDEDDVVWGNTDDGLALRVHALTYELGEELRVTLTNVASEPVDTGIKGKYYLQVFTEAGWQTVFGEPDSETPRPYVSLAVSHDPGQGFEWRLPLTERGVLKEFPRNEEFLVCPGLPAGRYRFVYWGATPDALAVAFDAST